MLRDFQNVGRQVVGTGLGVSRGLASLFGAAARGDRRAAWSAGLATARSAAQGTVGIGQSVLGLATSAAKTVVHAQWQAMNRIAEMGPPGMERSLQR